MDNIFPKNEKLYRAVYPPEAAELFWKADGSISSAAFADPKGLSVDRGDFRVDDPLTYIQLIQKVAHLPFDLFVDDVFYRLRRVLV